MKKLFANRNAKKSDGALDAERRGLRTAIDMVAYVNRKKLISGLSIPELVRYCRPAEAHHVSNKTRVFYRKYYSIGEVFRVRRDIRFAIQAERYRTGSCPGGIALLRSGCLKVKHGKDTNIYTGSVIQDAGSSRVSVVERRRKGQAHHYDAQDVTVWLQNEITKEWDYVCGKRQGR